MTNLDSGGGYGLTLVGVLDAVDSIWLSRGGGDGGAEQDVRNQAVEDTGEEQWENVEDDQVRHVDDQVKGTLQLEGAGLNGRTVTKPLGYGGGQSQPGAAVDDGEGPQTHDDALGPSYSAHGLCLHGMTYRNVPLHREGSDGQA